ncbi:MAG: copper resistance protein NlpE [Bacteroidales bacterium]
MRKTLFGLLCMALFSLGACKQKSAENTQPIVPDMHTAETSLDYPGVYEGVIPAASGPGIKITLTLNKDKTYEMVSDYIGEKNSIFTDKGNYEIDGNIITLNMKDDAPRYLKVEEGRVRMLDADKQVVKGALENDYILKQEKVF